MGRLGDEEAKPSPHLPLTTSVFSAHSALRQAQGKLCLFRKVADGFRFAHPTTFHRFGVSQRDMSYGSESTGKKLSSFKLYAPPLPVSSLQGEIS